MKDLRFFSRAIQMPKTRFLFGAFRVPALAAFTHIRVRCVLTKFAAIAARFLGLARTSRVLAFIRFLGLLFDVAHNFHFHSYIFLTSYLSASRMSAFALDSGYALRGALAIRTAVFIRVGGGAGTEFVPAFICFIGPFWGPFAVVHNFSLIFGTNNPGLPLRKEASP
jgi:hypothetical protein